MSVDTVLQPRFPDVPRARPHYESVYLTAHHPTEPEAVWLRHTVQKPPGSSPQGSLWFTRFRTDRASAGKVTTERLSVGDAGEVTIGGSSRIGLAGATGSIDCPTVQANWDLSFGEREPAMRHFPANWMYRAPLPKTKSISEAPAMRLSGEFTVDGAVTNVDGWRGTLGHNWGTQHAERWIWLHASGFDVGGWWFDAVIGRVRVGPITTPWIANGMLSIDGERRRIGGAAHLRATQVSERPDGCRVTVGTSGGRIAIEVDAAPSRFVGWRYRDPGGKEHEVANSSIASITVTPIFPGAPATTFRTAAGAYEIGATRAAIDVALQPYPD